MAEEDLGRADGALAAPLDRCVPRTPTRRSRGTPPLTFFLFPRARLTRLSRHLPPRPRFGITYAIMFLAGVGTLLPWNVFITERAYFDTRLAVPPATPALSRSFESVFGITYMFANTFALAAMVKFDGVTRLHRLAQVPLPLLGMAALLAFTGALTHAVGMSGDATMAWSLATLVCLGALTALVQGGSFGAASCLPPRYNQAIMSGQAVAGVVSAVVALASTLGSVPGDGDGDGDGDDSAQASTYFFTAAALLAACHVGCLFLPSVPFYRHHAARAKEARKTDRARRRRSRHRGDGDGVSGDGDGVSGDGDENSATAPLLDNASFEDEEAPFDALAEDDDDDGFVLPAGRTREGEMSLYRAAVCATFATTLTVFPAVTSAVCSARNGAARPPCVPDPPGQSRLFGDLWVPSLFLLFNVGDLCGRCAANAWPRAPPGARAAATAAAARIALIPPLLACNVVVADRWRFPRWFAGSDLAPIALVAALAFTNGHLASVCVMYGPALAPLSRRAEEGSKTSLAVVAGIAMGCVSSYALSAAMQA